MTELMMSTELVMPKFDPHRIYRTEHASDPDDVVERADGTWSALTRQRIRGNMTVFRWIIDLSEHGRTIVGTVEILRPDAETPHWNLIATTGPTSFKVVRPIARAKDAPPQYQLGNSPHAVPRDQAVDELQRDRNYVYGLDNDLFGSYDAGQMGWDKIITKLGADVAYLLDLDGAEQSDRYHQL